MNNSLLELKNKVLDDNSNKNMTEFLNYLINNNVSIPVEMQIPEDVQEKVNSLKQGEEYSFETDTLEFAPAILSSEEGDFLPVFSSEDECTEEDLKQRTWINLPFFEVINIYKSNGALKGVVLDPFTRSLLLNEQDMKNLENDIIASEGKEDK